MRIEEMPTLELLDMYGNILEELRERKIIRTSNAPLGDYAEYIVCNTYGFEQERNSKAGYDAIDNEGIRYQIKARRRTKHRSTRQLSDMRNLPDKKFDYLIGVLFNDNFTIIRAALIPHEIVLNNSIYIEYTNSWRFKLEDKIWEIDSVKDITKKLVKTQGLI